MKSCFRSMATVGRQLTHLYYHACLSLNTYSFKITYISLHSTNTGYKPFWKAMCCMTKDKMMNPEKTVITYSASKW